MISSLHLRLNLSIHPSNFFCDTRVPIIIGTPSTILSFHNLPISLFKSWYFSVFSLSFTTTLTSAKTAISLSPFLANYNYVWSCCLFHVVTLNIDIPQHFYFFIFYCPFSWTFFATLLCRLFILSELISHIHVLSVAHFHPFST